MEGVRDALRKAWPYGTLILLGLLAYWPMFQNDFVWDDLKFIVANPAIRGFWPITRFFQVQSSGIAYPLTGDRAAMVFSLALDFALWKLNPFGYHLTNLLLHLLCVFGVAWLALMITRSRGAGFMAGALFALHPGHAEGVIAFAGRSDLLACLFVLLGFWGYYRHRETGGWRRAVWYGVSLVSFLIACFSKETGLALLGLLLVYEVFETPESRIQDLKSKIISLLPFVLAGLVYWVHRTKVIGSQFAGSLWWGGSPYKNFLMAFEVYARYLRLLFFPLSLSPLHMVPVPGGFWDGRVLWGMILLIGTLGILCWSLKKHFWTGFLVSWFLISLAPVANLIPVPGAQILSEHRLYLPSVGACVLGGWGARALYLRARGWTRGCWAGLIGTVLVLFGIRTFSWIPKWKTPLSIARTVVATSPGYVNGYVNLGNALDQEGRFEEAESQYRRALSMNATCAEAHNDLGIELERKKQHEEAKRELLLAVGFKPDYSEAFNNLGNVVSELGELGEAEEAYRQALRLQPGFFQAYYNLGTTLEAEGKLAEAEGAYRETIRLVPNFAGTYYNLGNTLEGEGRWVEAAREYRLYLFYAPNAGNRNDVEALIQKLNSK